MRDGKQCESTTLLALPTTHRYVDGSVTGETASGVSSNNDLAGTKIESDRIEFNWEEGLRRGGLEGGNRKDICCPRCATTPKNHVSRITLSGPFRNERKRCHLALHPNVRSGFASVPFLRCPGRHRIFLEQEEPIDVLQRERESSTTEVTDTWCQPTQEASEVEVYPIELRSSAR